ncbi:MAG: VOC family protein [Armatimonadetes bacterium]|nr:VOC family protein [Armatimonadota bacterium]
MSGTNAAIPGCGFHHVAMRAADFDGAVRFYTEGLGFRAACSWGEGDSRAVMLDTGDGNYFEIFAGGKRAPGEAPPEGAVLHVALRADNCDATLERAVAAGAQVTMEPTSLDIPSSPATPVRIAFCKGPEGEIIEFFQCDRL